ncbi:protein translocase subunit SecD [Candidatus Calescamantes bacterium]|nr:protein translocase subunit SecD [Candidatus Calescamantes bacterium]
MHKSIIWRALLAVALAGISIWSFYPPEEKIKRGLDLKGGMHLVLGVETEKIPQEARKDAVERAVEVIRNRIDQFGVAEPLIQRQGEKQIVVELPGVVDTERALKVIGQTALLEFKLVERDPDLLQQALDGKVPEGYELKYLEENGEKTPLLLHKEPVLTGAYLVNAFVEYGRLGQPQVRLKFNRKGARIFSRVTGENVGSLLAIVLDGKLQSAPRIKEKIPNGEAIISGRFNMKEASDLALVLRAGALPAPIKVLSMLTVGPSLGEDSIRKGFNAALVGGMLVIVFMLLYYSFSGLIADFALVLNLILLMGALAGLKATLTLPGIAGIVLTIGMSVDANVLIFERIREELAKRKTIRVAVDAGYKRAFLTIADANITTLIAALMLFYFGTGPVKGFAVTLSLGIITSMFTAIVVTKLIFDYLIYVKKIKRINI